MAVLAFTITAVHAQTAPIQEQLQRERERVLRQQQEQRPDVSLGAPSKAAISAAVFPDDEQPCKKIDSITLDGDAADHFRFALDSVTGADGALGRCLGSKGVNAVLTRVQNAVIASGYTTTRILAMPQDLAGGKLTLTVVAGRVRAIRFAPGADVRGTAANALPISKGDLLNLRDIEQGLENFKRVPTAEVDIKITPAEGEDAQPGESDLVIQYRQAFPLRVSATLDDGGARATGKYLAGLTLAYDNWWTVNDLFYVNLSRSVGHYGDEGSSATTVHYSLPFGYWLFGTTISSNKYHQTVSGAFENFVYSGQSQTTELKLSRLIYRDSVRKTTVHLKGLVRNAHNAIDDTEIGAQQRRNTAWETGINHREFVGSSTLDATFAYRRSLDRQGAEPASEFDLPQIATRYGLLLADASINVPFKVGPVALRYSSAARAQWNRGNLPPQDQFSIGGRYTVRGFDGDLTLQAERGWFVRNELSAALGQSGQEFYAGVDTGQVAGPSAGFLTGRRLTGAAIGLRGALYKLSYDAFLATPLARPDHFATARVTGGFSLAWAF
ncbi:hemolysin activation/secretion protein [Herbaspirillum sp. YR522]|nr:hemolysin activation/secretion protein [Herbaspirillum sp. YR522]